MIPQIQVKSDRRPNVFSLFFLKKKKKKENH